MNNTPQSELQQAVENVNPSDIAKNLQKMDTNVEKPEDLATNQSTPFIDESVRTDK